MTLCIIPARSGSKRLPGKNWLTVGGKTLVERAVDCAIQAGLTPHIVTDAPERCAIPGAVVLREPDSIAGDDVPMGHVLSVMLPMMKTKHVPYVALLQPTSPLRTAEDLLACIHIAGRSGCDAVVSVAARNRTAISHAEPWDRQGIIRYEQEVHHIYERNGAIYIARTEQVLRGTLIGGWTQFYVMPPERSVDIDTAEDLEEARRLVGG